MFQRRRVGSVLLLSVAAAWSCSSGSEPQAPGEGGQAGEEPGGAGQVAGTGDMGGADGGGTGGSGTESSGGAGENAGGTSNGGAGAMHDAGAAGMGDAGTAGAPPLPAGYPPSKSPTWDGSLPTDGICSIDGWCWIMPTRPPNTLLDVWGSSNNDVWFAGLGSLLHYDGSKLTGITGVEGTWGGEPDQAQASITRVRGSGPTDVWALAVGGYFAPPSASNKRTLFHWDGGTWSVRPYTGAIKANTLWVQAPDDVWLFGDGGKASHFNGTSWLDSSTGTTANLTGAYGFASNDLFVVGGDVVRHWNGSSWADRSTGIPTGKKYNSGGVLKPAVLTAIWGSSANDLWVVGLGHDAYRSVNGGDWTFKVGGSWQNVAGISASDVLFVPADDDLDGYFYRWTGSSAAPEFSASHCVQTNAAWPANATSYVTAQTTDIGFMDFALCALGVVGDGSPSWPSATGDWGGAVYAASPADVYATYRVGEGPLQLRKRSGAAFIAVDTKLTFSPYSNAQPNERLLFSSRNAADIWVVNDLKGTASHWDGVSWTPGTICAAPATEVAIAPDGTAFAGCGNQLYISNGSGWTSLHEFDATISAVVAGADQTWVFANGLFRRDGSDWVAVPPSNGIQVDNLVGVDATQTLWAYVSDEASPDNLGRLGAMHAGTWTVYTFPAFLDQAVVRENEVWATSYGLGTYRFNGEKFDSYAPGSANWPYYQMSIAGPGEVWLQSLGGLLRYRDPP